MKFLLVSVSLLLLLSKAVVPVVGLLSSTTSRRRLVTTTTSCLRRRHISSSSSSSALFVSTGNIGLGPGKDSQQKSDQTWVEGVDYEVPDHEAYRTSRRSKLDEQCDDWFGTLLQAKNGVLGDDLCQTMRDILTTPVPLVNDVRLENKKEEEDWTPYVSTKLPWTPLVPAFGLEQYGLPIPRRNAETWRHFDVAGMVNTDYSGVPDDIGRVLELSTNKMMHCKENLIKAGGWLDDEDCMARLIYINGRFVPQLSKVTEYVYNVGDITVPSVVPTNLLGRLTDGFTDELAAPVPSGPSEFVTSYRKLSGPDHCVGNATSQFAINYQQGTACFAALNTICTGAVAYIHIPPNTNHDNNDDDHEDKKPVLLVNALTKNGGVVATTTMDNNNKAGVTLHPRCLAICEENSTLSLVQSIVDLDDDEEQQEQQQQQQHRAKLYNGYTQIFVKAGANVTHSYLEESGGVVTPGTEIRDSDLEQNVVPPREIEARRPELQNTHLESIDVHIMGDNGVYAGTLLNMGGSGRVRVALSVSLLRPGADATVNGFCLASGAQRTDIKTNIHHIAQGTKSQQNQRNMIGGRAIGAFRGRIRVEQSAQQTNSQQLSRSILLSDRARAWSVPSLEIIADDVICTHGATVSDLSEEELFYLRSRGLDRALARNLLMYAFAADSSHNVDPAMLGEVDSDRGLQKRMISRLENLVPQGDRAVKGEFQSI